MENETKRCPHCGAEIHAKAKKCRYCLKWIEEPSNYKTEKPSPQTSQESPNTYARKHISFMEVHNATYAMALKNSFWLIKTFLLYSLTAWIPYINIGTTIAIYNIPIALAHNTKHSSKSIFDKKYRKYLGEYISLWGNMILVFLVSLPFGTIPFIILYYGWSFAPLLLVDKELNPSEAMMQSTKITFGHKLQMWLMDSVITLEIFIAGAILFYITHNIEKTLSILIIIVLVLFFFALNISMTAVYYKKLTLE